MRHPLSVLVASAVPAIVGSVLLMRTSGAPSALIVQQLVVFVAGVGLTWGVATPRPQRTHASFAPWTMGVLAAALSVPLLVAADEGPSRWLQLGPMRLYLAPVLLPTLLFLLGTRWRTVTLVGVLAIAAAAVALWLQPDAAQLTAYACAVALIVATSRTTASVRVAILIALMGLALSCWWRPDPLAPVPHVEGVLHLAAGHGVVAGAAAIVAALLPAMTLAWLAWRVWSMALLACGTYLAVLVALAPLQVTPVPLLGFGAGPVLGYTALAALAARRVSSIEARRRDPLDSRVAPE